MSSRPAAQLNAMLRNLPDKTGRTLQGWLVFLRGREGEKHSALVKALKEEGVGHAYANLIAQAFRSPGPVRSASVESPGSDTLIDRQFHGKEGLRPIYEAVIAFVRRLGSDVEIAPKKAYVSLRRSKQFAIVQPSTRTRVDLGLKLAATAPSRPT